MELIGIEVQGYRRFRDPVRVRLLESLVALVGQNESGKTSFLEALEEFNSDEEIVDRDQTRRDSISTKVEATFELEEDDWADLSRIDGGDEIEQCVLTKSENGTISASLEPSPQHDLEPRKNVRSQLETLSESRVFDERFGNQAVQDVKKAIDVLDTERDYLGRNDIQFVKEPISDLNNAVENVDADDYDTGIIEDIIGSLEGLVEHEKSSPPEQARRILKRRCPSFLFFDDEDRSLDPTYELREEIPDPSPALANVAELAGLDLQALLEAADDENIAHRDDLLESANGELQRVFSEAWVRSDVVPVLGVDETVLHLNVRTPGGESRAPIDQRSEGLRWFVALLAFLNQKDTAGNPVLLVDEAESHLSYDAQAELIEVLETQEIAQKVIYTTHSAGCLPSDLGRGIRPVIQQEGERSDIKNGFWGEDPGFKPIMGAMGLGPLAFSIARNALIAEGPSETILLPTLIRHATGESELAYQIAPGAANVGGDRLPELLSETSRSVILLDGDEAGTKRREMLIEADADPEKVRTYADFADDALVIEDFIASETYAEAINDELNAYQEPEERFTADELPATNRVDAVTEWCDEHDLDSPTKSNVCQRVVEMSSDGISVLESDRADVLQDVHEWAMNHFVLFETDE